MLRSFFDRHVDKVELHIFGYSSHGVFSSVVCLRRKVKRGSYGKTELAIVFGRAQVALTKPWTIPKLELQSALLFARLTDEIQLALTVPVERTFRWTDITTALQWLQSIDKIPVFVANRVAETLELTTTDEWNYVQTSENPADAGTHGLLA